MPTVPDRLDRRVVSESILGLLRACGDVAPCHLGGGAALSGAYLRHRLTGDVDLFVHDREDMRGLVRELPSLAEHCRVGLTIQRDTGHLVRARIQAEDSDVELDVVHEPVPDLEPASEIEGVQVESLADLRANKITCILSRSEPRDLVDLLFLDRAGHRIEDDLQLALAKDAGVDPGTLSWLLTQFPVEPLPLMLDDLSVEELREFRDELAKRLRRLTAE